ncbi:MAG: hypothetical protein MZU84_09155 [Sphingobacterium sp.]|nr:hypothetical protein [Sphingobacterium sp.]
MCNASRGGGAIDEERGIAAVRSWSWPSSLCGGLRRRPRRRLAAALEILVTNDDGIEAPGHPGRWPKPFAPWDRSRSPRPSEGKSGLEPRRHVGPSPSPFARASGGRPARWIAIDALPATCVRLAMSKLLPSRGRTSSSPASTKGENLGTVTLLFGHRRRGPGGALPRRAGPRRHSRRVPGLPSISVGPQRTGWAASMAASVAARSSGARPDGLPKGTFLNVNIPSLPTGAARGVRIAPAGHPGARSITSIRWSLPTGSTLLLSEAGTHLEPDAGHRTSGRSATATSPSRCSASTSRPPRRSGGQACARPAPREPCSVRRRTTESA